MRNAMTLTLFISFCVCVCVSMFVCFLCVPDLNMLNIFCCTDCLAFLTLKFVFTLYNIVMSNCGIKFVVVVFFSALLVFFSLTSR